MVLVVLAYVETDRQVVGHPGQGGDEPGGQGVGVHHQGQPGADPVTGERAPRVGQRLPFQQRQLPGEAEQRPARLGGPTRPGTPDQHLPDGLLQGADPLADR
ncbi:hypothetical protein JD76_04184 [Micromonospora endolithica]|nr:hypothetical protein JD76_04184 [Micromonospora endolithica]